MEFYLFKCCILYYRFPVIPAKAGIQSVIGMDSGSHLRFGRNDN